MADPGPSAQQQSSIFVRALANQIARLRNIGRYVFVVQLFDSNTRKRLDRPSDGCRSREAGLTLRESNPQDC
jgi:hypothetical protein